MFPLYTQKVILIIIYEKRKFIFLLLRLWILMWNICVLYANFKWTIHRYQLAWRQNIILHSCTEDGVLFSLFTIWYSISKMNYIVQCLCNSKSEKHFHPCWTDNFPFDTSIIACSSTESLIWSLDALLWFCKRDTSKVDCTDAVSFQINFCKCICSLSWSPDGCRVFLTERSVRNISGLLWFFLLKKEVDLLNCILKQFQFNYKILCSIRLFMFSSDY